MISQQEKALCLINKFYLMMNRIKSNAIFLLNRTKALGKLLLDSFGTYRETRGRSNCLCYSLGMQQWVTIWRAKLIIHGWPNLSLTCLSINRSVVVVFT